MLLHTVGLGLLVGSDVQRTTTLSIKEGLITTGYFGRTRNPNYLGELMICLSYAVLSKSVFCWIYMFLIWIIVFGSNILKKEVSLMKKEGYADYKQHTLILLPRLFGDYKKNYRFFGGLFAFIFVLYLIGGFFYIFGIKSPRKTYELY